MCGEVLLAVAILTQARKDLRSAVAPVRADAEAFFQDQGALIFWADLVGVDATQLQRVLCQG